MGCVAAADCDGFLEAITLPMVGVGLVTVIPSAPAALGTFELASMALLAILGIKKAAAFSFTIVMHLMWSFPLLIAGLVLLWRTGYSRLKPQREPESPA